MGLGVGLGSTIGTSEWYYNDTPGADLLGGRQGWLGEGKGDTWNGV